MELLRGLLKWIILAILIILVVVLVIRFSNKNEVKNNQTKEPTVNIVDRNNSEEEADEDGLEPIEENLSVDSPDTASSGIKETLIGILIIGYGLGYIHKRSTIKGNS